MTEKDIQEILQTIDDPYTDIDFITQRAVKSIKVEDNNVEIHLVLGYPIQGAISEIEQLITQNIRMRLPIEKVMLKIEQKIVAHKAQANLTPFPTIKNIIAIASGKGGVGKSTTAVNLALALQTEGANVGLLDADIYGPCQPQMLGLSGRPESIDNKIMLPMKAYGLQVMSIGFLVETETAMIWRGPMVTTALTQLLQETRWDNLDYLIIDLPPGTGDIQLTLAQKIPVTGAVIITTPQDIALLDAVRGFKMFEKVHIPVLGVIENMSTHICSKCGNEEAIFGTGGGEKMCRDHHIEFLGKIPLDMQIRVQSDQGAPIVISNPEGAYAKSYKKIARRIAGQIAVRPQDHSHKIPKIVASST